MTGLLVFIIFIILIGGFATYAILSTKKAIKENKETWLMRFWRKDSVKAISASLISILCGMILGSIILLLIAGKTIGGITISGKSGWEGIQLIFIGVFNIGRNLDGQIIYGFNGTNIGDVFNNATPLIMTGLSVALAFKTGLFNIGAPGQYLMGTASTLIIALSIPSSAVPTGLIWIIAFIGGILAGALWGAIPGVFKAYLNVNEVITCIMTNWIAANVVTSLFDNTTGPFKHLLDPSKTKNWAYVYKTTHNGVSTLKLGLDKIFAGSQINAGILVAILFAILVYIILNKTTFGYELKACGSNKNAAKYAGINEKRSIILSMAIAGGLAGGGAALYYLAGNTEFYWSTYQALPSAGFNGIPVALLAMNNPVGVIFAASFMAYLDVAGMQLKYLTSYNEYITSIIAAVIVYFSAFSLLIKQVLNGTIKLNFLKKREKKVIEEIENDKKEIDSGEVNE